MKKYHSFTAGVVATLMAVSTVGTALAASSRVEYNKAGISLFGENKVLTGESYKAPNGQDVPSVITYVDETGGKTNYLSIRQISELLDASVGWNAATNSVDIAAPNAGKIGEDVIVGSGQLGGRPCGLCGGRRERGRWQYSRQRHEAGAGDCPWAVHRDRPGQGCRKVSDGRPSG